MSPGPVTRIPLESRNSLSSLSAAAAPPKAMASSILVFPQPFSPIAIFPDKNIKPAQLQFQFLDRFEIFDGNYLSLASRNSIEKKL